MSDGIDIPNAPEGQSKRGRRSPNHGEIGIRYGGRNFLITPGQGLVAQDGPWHLVAVPVWDRPGWTNFKLYLNQKAKKNLFNLSVNKRSLFGKRDFQILEEHHAGRKDWVLEQALLFIDGKILIRPERGTKIRFSKFKGWAKVVKGKEQK